MPRLIWDFATRTLILLVLSFSGSFVFIDSLTDVHLDPKYPPFEGHTRTNKEMFHIIAHNEFSYLLFNTTDNSHCLTVRNPNAHRIYMRCDKLSFNVDSEKEMRNIEEQN